MSSRRPRGVGQPSNGVPMYSISSPLAQAYNGDGMPQQGITFANQNDEDRYGSDGDSSDDSRTQNPGRKKNGQAKGNSTAHEPPADPKTLLERDTKRLLIGLMFPIVEVVGGILLDRFIEFDLGAIVIRSLVDNATAGGVLSVISTKGARLVSLVKYEDTNFYHISVDGVSQSLCAPTTVHLPALADVPKIEGASISLYSETDDIAPRIAAIDGGGPGPQPPDAQGTLDGFKIPKLVNRSAFGATAKTLGALLQTDPLHVELVGPTTTIDEIEARFESLAVFALQSEAVLIPTLHSVVSLPLSTARYVAEITDRRQIAMAQQRAEAIQKQSGQAIGAREPKGFYQTIVQKNIAKSTTDQASARGRRNSYWEAASGDASDIGNGTQNTSKFKNYFERYTDSHVPDDDTDAPLGGVPARGLSSHVPPVQFAVDELCLQIRQTRPKSSIASEVLRIRGLVARYAISKSYDSAAHLVPCICNLLEVMLDDNTTEHLMDLVGGLVVALIKSVMASQMDVVFYDVRPTIATLLVSVLRKLVGSSHEEATADLLRKSARHQSDRSLATITEPLMTTDGSNTSVSNLSQWVWPSGSIKQSNGLAKGSNEGKMAVVLPSSVKEHIARPLKHQQQRGDPPAEPYLPELVAMHRAYFVDLLLPPPLLRQEGIYSCIAAALGTITELDLLCAMQVTHFADDCNDNVSVLTEGRARGVERSDRFGYTGHSTGYSLVICHSVRSVRSELMLAFPLIPSSSEDVSELTKLLLFKSKGCSAADLREGLLGHPLVPRPAGLQGLTDAQMGDSICTSLGRNSEEFELTAQHLWPAILTAISMGSHLLNDCTCWAGPILTPFENSLFEELLSDMLHIIIGSCHMLWGLRPQLSGPMLAHAMTKFTSALRRASASWVDLIGLTSSETRCLLTRAATALLITKSIPRAYLPASSASDLDTAADAAYLAPTKHLLHTPIDWLVRATSTSGGIAEHAMMLEYHQFYCASVFWLEPTWWASQGPQGTYEGSTGPTENVSQNVFAETWVIVDAAVRGVRDLMPSPSPALLLWDSVCRTTQAFATLQSARDSTEARVLLAVSALVAVRRERQQSVLPKSRGSGEHYSGEITGAFAKNSNIHKLSDGADGWEDYDSFTSKSRSAFIGRKHQDNESVQGCMPALIYVLGWLGHEMLSRRLRVASSAASQLARQLGKAGAPQLVTDAFSQLALTVLALQEGSKLEGIVDTLRVMGLHFAAGMYGRLDMQSGAAASPLLGDAMHTQRLPHNNGRAAQPLQPAVPMASYKGEARFRYDTNPSHSDDDSIPRSRAGMPPTAAPPIVGLNASRSTSPNGAPIAVPTQWPEVRQVSRLAASGAVGAGVTMFRKLQRVSDSATANTARPSPRPTPAGGVSGRKIDVLDLVAQAYR